MKRTFALRDHGSAPNDPTNMSVLRKAFITYIRPQFKYASSIWSPTQAGLVVKVESVQRQFIKRIPALQELS